MLINEAVYGIELDIALAYVRPLNRHTSGPLTTTQGMKKLLTNANPTPR